MNYVVLDLEWNQPFSIKQMVKTPVPLVGEIVQIGAVKLDSGFRIVNTFKTMVVPRYYKKMHGKVARLTHINSDDLKYGLSFGRATELFKKWCKDDFAFITWGWDDIKILKDNLALNGLDASWVPENYNLQIIFDDRITGEMRQISLSRAMEILSLEARDAHDALNDAYNTALICQKLDMEDALKNYGEIESRYHAPLSEVISVISDKRYKSRTDATGDVALSRFSCIGCGKTVTRGELVPQNGSKYTATAKCSCGREYLYRLRLKKNADGTLRAGFGVYDMDEDLAADFEKTRDEYLKRKQFWLDRHSAAQANAGGSAESV